MFHGNVTLTRRQFVNGFGVAAATLLMPGVHAGATDPDCIELRAYPVPAGSGPHDVAPAADGVRVWFTAQRSGDLGKFDPFAEEVEMIDLGEESAPHGVLSGPDGSPWITDGGRDEIVRVDAETNVVTRFPTGLSRAGLNTAAFDGDGALWFTGQGGYLGRLDPSNGEVVTIEAPRGRGPYGICATPNGAVWFVSLAGNFLGRLRFKNGVIRASEIDPPAAASGPRRVWADSTGRLWVAHWYAGLVSMYDPAAKTWREWRLPGDSPQAYAVYVDEWDMVWLTDFGSNSVMRFDPADESFNVLQLPHDRGKVRQLAGRPGEI